MSHPFRLFVGLAILLSQPLFCAGQQAARPDPEIQILKDRVTTLEHDLELQRQYSDKRADEQLQAINKRFDEAQQRTDWILKLLGAFGALGGVFGVVSWYKGRQDYLNERGFYEKRMSGIDEQQREWARQQSGLGQIALNRSDSMLGSQIESIGKLKDVIELVRQSFQLQVDNQGNLKVVNELITDLDKYASVRDRILPLQKITRMGWPSLGVFQLKLAQGARADFRSIPDSLLRRDEEKEPYEFARVCQILGASAFYANDIEFAERLLKRAASGYESKPTRQDHQEPMAACYYFLGLISKNWVDENGRLEDGIGIAKKQLEKAQDILKEKKDEFLIPITLAEVFSYIEVDRPKARNELSANVRSLRKLKEMNPNQKKLLLRALILQGNLEERVTEKVARYEEALKEDENSAYAWLSLALITDDPASRKERFQKGIGALKESRLLDKAEITTRATAVAWDVIASNELGESPASRLRTLENLQQSTINTGGRIPVFFCPISKVLCTFEKLYENVVSYIDRGKSEAA